MMDLEKTIDILLVEDNPDDTELTTHALAESSKLQLAHLRDGVEALKFIFARRTYPEASFLSNLTLVLLDLNLPRMDGLEVLRKIRENEATKALPMVILLVSRKKGHTGSL